MDDFAPYKDAFEIALVNLEKVLERCEQTNVSLSTEKCHMMMNEGIMLGQSYFRFCAYFRHLLPLILDHFTYELVDFIS